jgi:kinesin family protein 3/17
VEFVLAGYNGTVFAYGQTGTGKTHTMEGEIHDADLKGVTPRAFEHVFAHIAGMQSASPGAQCLVTCQFVEIYMEDVMDLLAETTGKASDRQKLQLKETAEGSIFVAGASKHTVRSAAELMTWLEKGKKNKQVGATKMNAGSSRSHCIFTVTVETCEVREDGHEHIRVGKLNLVDLAGSERQGKTGASGQRLKEATRINLSLTCLGQVISALTSRTPAPLTYRNSKLTRLLQDSLGGNTKTVMIANVGPADYNHDETVETLRFAARAKLIKNKPKINEDPRDAMLRDYQDEITRLRKALEAADSLEAGADPEALAALLGGAGGAPEERVVEQVEMVGVQREELDKVEEARKQTLATLEQRHLQETAALAALQSEISDKASATKEQLAARTLLLEKQRETKRQLHEQLQAAEARLQMDQRVLAEARRDAELLEQRHMEVEKAEKQAQARRAHLAKQEEDFFASLQKKTKVDEDLHGQKRRLTRLQDKYRALKSETSEVMRSITNEREELLEEIRELSRHVQFQSLLLQHFVPKEQARVVESRAVWDEERDMYVLKKFNFKESNKRERRPRSVYGMVVNPVDISQPDPRNPLPASITGPSQVLQPFVQMAHRPVTLSEMVLRAQGQGGVRYGVTNAMQSSLDVHERTTQDLADLGLDDADA